MREDAARRLEAGGGLLAQLRPELAAAQAFNRALEAIFQVVAEANRYVDVQAPWTLRKTDTARMETVLYVLAETIRRVAIVLQPFMPSSMAKLLDQLAVPTDARDFAHFDARLAPGTALPPPSCVFPRHQEQAG
ncbi:MAG: hypothetical protein ACKOUS_17765 [Alphaproteobacteria bacterium]